VQYKQVKERKVKEAARSAAATEAGQRTLDGKKAEINGEIEDSDAPASMPHLQTASDNMEVEIEIRGSRSNSNGAAMPASINGHGASDDVAME
jgi:hypothetical protein